MGGTAVELTIALSGVWKAVQSHHPEVPHVVLLAAPNPHTNTNVLGHFAALRWTATPGHGGILHEVVVVAEHLNRSAEDVVATLIHEAGHALNFARGIHDCSRSQYHNRKFEAAAKELGLDVTQVAHYGFALTAMPAETAQRYNAETEALRQVLMHRRPMVSASKPTATGAGDSGDDESDDADPPDKGGRYKKASCKCPFNIRVARATLAATTIQCATCGESFQLVA